MERDRKTDAEEESQGSDKITKRTETGTPRGMFQYNVLHSGRLIYKHNDIEERKNGRVRASEREKITRKAEGLAIH